MDKNELANQEVVKGMEEKSSIAEETKSESNESEQVPVIEAILQEQDVLGESEENLNLAFDALQVTNHAVVEETTNDLPTLPLKQTKPASSNESVSLQDTGSEVSLPWTVLDQINEPASVPQLGTRVSLDKNRNSNNVEYISEFETRRGDVKVSFQKYMTSHPQVRSLLSDYLQMILLRKPDNVYQFTRDYFK
jgi:hypothetical protein